MLNAMMRLPYLVLLPRLFILMIKLLGLQLANPLPQLFGFFPASARKKESDRWIGVHRSEHEAFFCHRVYLYLTWVGPLSCDRHLTLGVDRWGSSSSFPAPFVFSRPAASAVGEEGTWSDVHMYTHDMLANYCFRYKEKRSSLCIRCN